MSIDIEVLEVLVWAKAQGPVLMINHGLKPA